MQKVEHSALVPHSAQQMFDLVNDVDKYYEFLPFCCDSNVKTRSDTELVGCMSLGKGMVKTNFVTRNVLTSPDKIEMHLKEGPFKHLYGVWLFKPLSDKGCKISFDLEFELDKGFMMKIIAPVFDQVSNSMVDAFCKRADEIYKN